MNFSSDAFGQPIDRTNANRLFNNYIKIKTEVAPQLAKMPLTNASKRFYMGRNSMDPLMEDWAYIFDKTAFAEFFKMFTDGTADGLMIFNGAREKKDSPVVPGDLHPEQDGRPTLMVFPVKYGNSAVQVLVDSGREHPGTGGGKGFVRTVGTNAVELPASIEDSQIHHWTALQL